MLTATRIFDGRLAPCPACGGQAAVPVYTDAMPCPTCGERLAVPPTAPVGWFFTPVRVARIGLREDVAFGPFPSREQAEARSRKPVRSHAHILKEN